MSSIRTRTAFVLIAISIISILIIGSIWVKTANDRLKNDIYVSNLQDSRYIANYVHMYMENITSSVNVIASDQNTISAIKEPDLESLSKIAWNLNDSITQVNAVHISNSSGSILYTTRPSNISKISQFEWYDDTIPKNQSNITGIYYSPGTQDHVFAIITPVRDEREYVGNIIVAININDLEKNVKGQIIDPVRTIVLVDDSGKVVFCKNDTGTKKHENKSAVLPVRNVLKGMEGNVEYFDDSCDQFLIAGYYPVPVIGWGVVITTPASLLYEQFLEHLKWIAGTLVFLTMIMMALSYFVSKYLTGPVIRLSDTMKLTSSGDYSLRVESSRKDEIGDLARTFNSMMDELEVKNERLMMEKIRSELYLDLMSHDINNMNQSAMGYLELALDRLKLDEDTKTYILKPMENLRNSSKLIENIRKLKQAEDVKVKRTVFDLNLMLKDVIARFSHVQGRNVTINYSPKEGCLTEADELLRDVFVNLIGNAIKHSEGPVTIDVDLSMVNFENKEYYQVSVSDNGPGIPDDKKPMIFSLKPERLRSGIRGLGLYLVRSLVSDYQGHVRVEDRIPGDSSKGSRFIVLLPKYQK